MKIDNFFAKLKQRNVYKITQIILSFAS